MIALCANCDDFQRVFFVSFNLLLMFRFFRFWAYKENIMHREILLSTIILGSMTYFFHSGSEVTIPILYRLVNTASLVFPYFPINQALKARALQQIHELASLLKGSLCNEVILTNLGRKQNNPWNCWAINFYILSCKNAEPLPFLIASWALLSQCFGFYFAESCTDDKKVHGYQRAMLLAREPQKRLAAIFDAACRFQAWNLRFLRANCNKTQLHDWLLSSSTFYQGSGWHF